MRIQTFRSKPRRFIHHGPFPVGTSIQSSIASEHQYQPSLPSFTSIKASLLQIFKFSLHCLLLVQALSLVWSSLLHSWFCCVGSSPLFLEIIVDLYIESSQILHWGRKRGYDFQTINHFLCYAITRVIQINNFFTGCPCISGANNCPDLIKVLSFWSVRSLFTFTFLFL